MPPSKPGNNGSSLDGCKFHRNRLSAPWILLTADQGEYRRLEATAMLISQRDRVSLDRQLGILQAAQRLQFPADDDRHILAGRVEIVEIQHDARPIVSSSGAVRYPQSASRTARPTVR
jgi:hypothetical protein